MEIYLHVPYCRQKCRYCDFASFPHAESTQRAYVDAVLTEAASQAAKIPHGAMETAYLGGGTPSILPPELLTRLLEGVTAHFPLAPGAEFTSEANPGTLTHAWLDAALSCGINRLSMGMQAAQPALLKMLGRIHDFTQMQQSVELARHAGFQHISLDLMFGLPGQTVSMWRETLEKALSLNPEHLSCYGLIPEEGTPLYRDLQTGQLTLPDEDDERRMYDLTLDLLAQSGFQQYEISNFARPGCECRHNIGYWQQVPYIGLGVSAASYLPAKNGMIRLTNPRTLPAYLRMVQSQDDSLREREFVSKTDGRFEIAITDQGPGIPPEEQERIYRRFYQVDSSHQQEGNGLGLALCKQILDDCGGTIRAENQSPCGCRFIVTLPEKMTGEEAKQEEAHGTGK